MQISQVSFGKKIPKYQCKIQNKQTGNFEPATFFEVDCKDKQDYKRIKDLDDSWTFSYYLSEDMEKKYIQEKHLKRKSKKQEKSKNSFYILEDKNEKILGISEVGNNKEIHEIKFLESNTNNKYKYVGQNLMAGIGKELLNKDGTTLTLLALEEAVPFYKKLGFEHFSIFRMEMQKEDIKSMIEKVENNTQSPLIYIEA